MKFLTVLYPRRLTARIACGLAVLTAAASLAACSQQTAQAPVDKTLTIGITQEPDGFGPMFAQAGSTQVEQTLDASFTYRGADLKVHPWLVTRVPTIQNGDWVIHKNGTMDVTWTLRPNIKWSDGTPLTVADVLFGYEVEKNPHFPAIDSDTSMISSVTKVNDRTFVVHWNQPWPYANQGMGEIADGNVYPLPVHILGKLYAAAQQTGDWTPFTNSSYWTTKFVGTGPYKIVSWQHGSQITETANPYYFLGTPKIKNLVWKFFADSDTLLASILSGEVDVSVSPGLSVQQALTVRQRWGKTGGTVTSYPGYYWDWIAFNGQQDPQLQDIRVRQALLLSINRSELVKAVSDNIDTVANSPLPPADPLNGPAIQAATTTYPYDPQKAASLFAQAGYQRGPDGILEKDGQKLSISIRTLSGNQEYDQTEAIVMSYWQKAGVQVTIDNRPQNFIYDPSQLFHFGWPSAFLFNFGSNPDILDDLTSTWLCSSIPSQANDFGGANLGQYCNQQYDATYNADPTLKQLTLAGQQKSVARLMSIWTRDLPVLPLFFKSYILTARKGVTGINGVSGTNEGWMATIATWDVTSGS